MQRKSFNHVYRTAFVGLMCGFTLLLGACSDSDNTASTVDPVMGFASVETPTTDAEKRAVLASDSVVIDGTTYDIGYHTIARTGDVIGEDGYVFGQIIDINGDPILNEDGSPFNSVSADFSSLLKVGEKLFMVTHFESRPGAMYLTELKQDAATGLLSAVKTQPIDFSAIAGGWVHCAGSVTPWNTHLGSEEYEPDAREFEAATTMDEWDDYGHPMLRYFGVDPATATIAEAREVFNPYNYGWPLEVTVQEDGNYSAVKHYATGRTALELAYVMPDQKTVYMSDDGTNVGLFMFIADQAGDLSAGTLYAAKWNQTSDVDGGSANIDWVSLGHADQSDIENALKEKVTFSDIFETAEPGEGDTCPEGYSSINTSWGHECLSVIEGQETLASRLETRRYAAMKGATTELRKEEGITYDPNSNSLFVAMSEVAKGMEAESSYDAGGPDHVQLPVNKCGTVYQSSLATDVTIGSDYVVQDMIGLISGIPTEYADDSPFAGNTCDVDGISNPDNVTFIPSQNTLIIGEDTGSGHQNDLIWAYDMETAELSRIQTTPYGSETTSPYFYPSINGHGYVISVIQHPFGESDSDELADSAEANAYVGYIGPFPALGDEVPDTVDNTRGMSGTEALSFAKTAVPVTDEDKAKVWASPSVSVDGQGNEIGFQAILRSGESLGGNIFGQLFDINGDPILEEDGSVVISQSNDFASLLNLDNGLFMVSHFESRPGAMYLTELSQDSGTGQLSAVSTRNIDFSGIYGGWVHCAGSVTPWETHLGSEEYEPDAREFEAATTMDEWDDYGHPMLRYFDVDPDTATIADAREVFNPYAYGYPIEVAVDGAGEPVVNKHFAMGRMALELAYVMPDEKTVYMTDDGTDVGLFMFVADTAGDLTAGTLFAAELVQTSAENGGEFNLIWHDMGYADQATIATAVADKVTFTDIFDAADPVSEGICPMDYTSVHTTWGHECLSVIEGQETLASRLESRRYAAMLGATTELRKEEGVTFDPDSMTLFVAMSEVAKGMLDGSSNDVGGPNHIKLPENKCGTVYALNVDQNYVAQDMVGLISGTPLAYSDDSMFANNSCDINGLSNPDNITYIQGYDTLIIGEDTGSGHQNDAIWAYNTETEKMTRIQTTPYGSETTSPYIYRNINGFGYLMSVIQHPYGESDTDKLADPADASAYTGYVGPFPPLDQPME